MNCLRCEAIKKDNTDRQVEIGRELRREMFHPTPAGKLGIDRLLFLQQCGHAASQDRRLIDGVARICETSTKRHCANPFCLEMIEKDAWLAGRGDCGLCAPDSEEVDRKLAAMVEQAEVRRAARQLSLLAETKRKKGRGAKKS